MEPVLHGLDPHIVVSLVCSDFVITSFIELDNILFSFALVLQR